MRRYLTVHGSNNIDNDCYIYESAIKYLENLLGKPLGERLEADELISHSPAMLDYFAREKMKRILGLCVQAKEEGSYIQVC